MANNADQSRVFYISDTKLYAPVELYELKIIKMFEQLKSGFRKTIK